MIMENEPRDIMLTDRLGRRSLFLHSRVGIHFNSILAQGGFLFDE